MSTFSFPFWFQEGLPEFEAVGGPTNYNNMLLLDMTLNDYLPRLDEVGGYYAYRAGESFLTFVSQTYGREKVMELFHAAHTSRDMDGACDRVFGMKLKDIQLRWRNWLKREYYSTIDTFDVPYEKFEQRTDHEKTMSYYQYAPRFSPDGRRYLYYAGRNLHYGIWEGSTLGIRHDRQVLQGEDKPAVEEFHLMRNNISWFPDSKRFAFVAEATGGDRIYVMNADTGEFLDSYTFPELDNIYEIDVSHDGARIAFSGQKRMATDLYVFSIASGELTQLTSDRYDDSSPRWSPDDTRIAFCSERSTIPQPDSAHVFYALNKDIYYYDLTEAAFYQVTDDPWNNTQPIWNNTGSLLLFISESDLVANFEAVELESGRRACVTNALCGVFTGDLSSSNEQLVFGCFYGNGWDIYLYSNPLADVTFRPYHTPVLVQPTNDFYARFRIDRYRYYGRIRGEFKNELPPPRSRNVTTLDFGNVAERDSLAREWNRNLDARPDSTANPPQVAPYKLRFTLDRLWGGMAYSPSYGMYGYLQFSMSDLMGDPAFGAQISMAGDFEDSDYIFNYVYLARRIDYGFGIFHISDATYYDDVYDPVYHYYFDAKLRDRYYGVYTAFSYPFNRFWRASWENMLYREQEKLFYWDDYDEEWNEVDSWPASFVYKPALSLVHDNTVNGYTGPMSGWKGAVVVSKSFSNEYSYITAYTDDRCYLLFSRRYALAFRGIAGASEGSDPESFDLVGFSGVRGYDDDEVEGTRKVLASAELRFPFIEQLSMNFPLPLAIYQLRGSAFVDAGAVWEGGKFRGAIDGRLNDVKFGFGFGPRINLGYFVLKFDVAWNSNFHGTSKPSYYVTLYPDF